MNGNERIVGGDHAERKVWEPCSVEAKVKARIGKKNPLFCVVKDTKICVVELTDLIELVIDSNGVENICTSQ